MQSPGSVPSSDEHHFCVVFLETFRLKHSVYGRNVGGTDEMRKKKVEFGARLGLVKKAV